VFASLLLSLRAHVRRNAVRLPTHVKRLEIRGDILSVELTRTGRLTDGDQVLCVAGEIIPAAGAVVGGRALLRDISDASEWRVAVGSRVVAGMYVATDHVVICIDAISETDLQERVLTA
jgi:high-affinity K+ transport system ATPase subunit B